MLADLPITSLLYFFGKVVCCSSKRDRCEGTWLGWPRVTLQCNGLQISSTSAGSGKIASQRIRWKFSPALSYSSGKPVIPKPPRFNTLNANWIEEFCRIIHSGFVHSKFNSISLKFVWEYGSPIERIYLEKMYYISI